MEQAQRSRRWLLVVVAVVALGLVGAVLAVTRGPDGKPAANASSTPSAGADPAAERDKRVAAGIDGVLEVRAAAVMSGRLDRFLALVDPGNQALRRSQATLFANLRKLGLQSLSYRRLVPFIPEAVGGGRYQMHVMSFVQVRGIDPAPRMTARLYTLADQSGTWRLTADQPEPRAEGSEPWDLDPIEVVRGPRVAVVVDTGERHNGSRLATESAAALRAVRDILGRAPAGILVVAVADKRAIGDVVAAGGHQAVAVARPNLVMKDPSDLTLARVSGSRVVVNPGVRREANRYLMSHEFTHVVMAPLGGNSPLWLVEGLAEYTLYAFNERTGHRAWVADQRAEVRRKSIPDLTVLPIDGVFRGDFGDDSYGVSWVITEYLVRTYGVRTVLALYADLAKSSDDPAIRERILRKHLRAGETAVVAAVRHG
jgi:hypothetical protein